MSEFKQLLNYYVRFHFLRINMKFYCTKNIFTFNVHLVYKSLSFIVFLWGLCQMYYYTRGKDDGINDPDRSR